MIPLGLYGAARPVASGALAFCAHTADFSTVPVGEASADRTVIAVFTSYVYQHYPPAVSIGGVPATLDLVHAPFGEVYLGSVIYARAAVPLGSTASISVTGGVAYRYSTVATWAWYGSALSVVDTDFQAIQSADISLSSVGGWPVIANIQTGADWDIALSIGTTPDYEDFIWRNSAGVGLIASGITTDLSATAASDYGGVEIAAVAYGPA